MTRSRWTKRITANLTGPAVAALDELPGRDMTDAINRAIRTAAIVGRHTTVDGRLTVLTADGTPIEIHIPGPSGDFEPLAVGQSGRV